MNKFLNYVIVHILLGKNKYDAEKNYSIFINELYEM